MHFLQIPIVVTRFKHLTPHEKMLVGFLYYLWKNDKNLTASNNYITRTLGISRRSIQYSFSYLSGKEIKQGKNIRKMTTPPYIEIGFNKHNGHRTVKLKDQFGEVLDELTDKVKKAGAQQNIKWERPSEMKTVELDPEFQKDNQDLPVGFSKWNDREQKLYQRYVFGT